MTRRRTDDNQLQIMADVRKAGYTVTDTHDVGNGFPDVVIRSKANKLVAVEIKSVGGTLTKAEKKWHADHDGCPKGIAYNTEQVLAIMACYDELED